MTDEIVLRREPVEHIPVIVPESPNMSRFECGCGAVGVNRNIRSAAIGDARFHVKYHADGPRYVDEAGNEWRKVTP